LRPLYSPIANYFFGIISATLAAQIFTVPLCLYYFHQIPLLFLLTNLVAIPITLCVLVLELGVLLFHFIAPSISMLIAKLASTLIVLINKFTYKISQAHFSTVQNIHVELITMLILLTMIALLSYAIVRKSKVALWTFLASFIVLALSIYNERKSLGNQLIVFHIPQQSYFALVVNGNFFENTKLESDNWKRYVEPAHVAKHIKYTANWQRVEQGGNHLYQIGSFKIAHLTRPLDSISPAINLVILSDNVSVPLQQLNHCRLVIDPSCKAWYKNKVLQAYPQSWSIADRGALVLDLPSI
jgi:competence protein ComEC